MHVIVLVILLYIHKSEGFLPSSLTLGKCAVGHDEEKVVMMRRAPPGGGGGGGGILTLLVLLVHNLPSQTSTATAATQQSSDHEEPFFIATEQQQGSIHYYCRALGGEIRKIKLENDNDGFLTKLSVPTFATFPVVAAADQSSFDNYHGETFMSENNTMTDNVVPFHAHAVNPKQKSLDGIIPGAFLVEDAIHPIDCESIIEACEKIGFGKFNAGKNNHGAMQILVTEQAAQAVGKHIFKYLDVDKSIHGSIALSCPKSLQEEEEAESTSIKQQNQYQVVGLNQRWRIYRYEAGGEEKFAPHIDAGFPPSALSDDGTTLIWDASSSIGQNQQEQQQRYPNDTVSRLTVLMYLNDDFEGGHTNFYAPMVHSKGRHHHHHPLEVIASITPKTGSILLFPQAVGEEAVEYARQHWPLHEGSPVFHGRPKYVIRSDVLFAKVR